jgi:NitT/TauT family transport system substrate-binding protein
MFRKKNTTAALLIVCLGLLFTACGQADKPVQGAGSAKPADNTGAKVQSAEKVKLKVGHLNITSGAGTYIALEKGYFEKEGISLELSAFKTAGDQISVLATGDLDVGVGTVNAGLFNAIGRGIPLQLVADHGTSLVKHSASSIAIRKDLMDEGKFKDYPDFKGKKVAISAQGSSSNILVDMALKKGNVDPKDVNVIVMGFPEMLTAFKNKAIDAAIFQEPLTTQAIEQGLIVRWKGADEIYPNSQIASVIFSPKFAKERPEIGKKYIKAYLQGVRDYVNAFDKNINKQEIVTILMKHTSITDPKLFDKMVPSGLNPNGYLNEQGLKDDLEWYSQHGFIEKKPEFKDLYDKQFVDAAIKELGEYK